MEMAVGETPGWGGGMGGYGGSLRGEGERVGRAVGEWGGGGTVGDPQRVGKEGRVRWGRGGDPRVFGGVVGGMRWEWGRRWEKGPKMGRGKGESVGNRGGGGRDPPPTLMGIGGVNGREHLMEWEKGICSKMGGKGKGSAGLRW